MLEIEDWVSDLLCFVGRLIQYFVKSVCFRLIISGVDISMIA